MNCGGCGMVCDGPCVEGSCDPVVDGGAGLANSCVLRAGGRVFCSGQNNIGQLGVNSLENNGRFAEVPNLSAFDLDSGDASSCAIRESDRSVVCWGRGNNGEIGNNVAGRALVPTEVTSTDPMFATRRFVEVQLRRRSVCALDETGDLWCWGENNFGQLGNGTNTGALQAVKILSNVTDFSIGGFHGCAVSSGTLMCWGRGTFGQIGDGTLNNELSPVMTTPALTDVDEVEASNNATCARSGNILRCWGIFNNAGQGSTSNVLVPTIVNLAGIDAVYALRRSMCAHLESGSFVCWGERGEGQLGDGVVSTASVNAPIPAPWIPGDAKLFGDLTVFAATTASLSVWGSNLMGQYGIDAEHSASATPKVAKIEDSTTTMSGVTDISVGSTYACAVSNGDVRCAGRNFDFTLGIPNRRDRSTFDLNTLSNATAVSSGYRHACALSGGDLYCWGSETRQQFGGAGSQARPSLIPVTTTTPGSVIGLSAGVEHNCVIHGNGQVSCVGRNDRGQVGNGATGDTSTWTDVPGVSNATQVAAGFYSTCALLTDGSVTCWGDNANGELGDGTTTRSLVPKTVAGLSNVTELRAGRDHYCAITSSRALFCWGNNPNGQIGNGTTTDALVPTMILPSSATSVAPSLSHTCVALEDGTVRCWGGNTNHQLGDGTRMQSTSPVPGPSITTAVSISSGHYGSEHTCAILQDGTVNCWGNHTYGRLGDGRPMFDGTPRTVTLP